MQRSMQLYRENEKKNYSLLSTFSVDS